MDAEQFEQIVSVIDLIVHGEYLYDKESGKKLRFAEIVFTDEDSDDCPAYSMDNLYDLEKWVEPRTEAEMLLERIAALEKIIADFEPVAKNGRKERVVLDANERLAVAQWFKSQMNDENSSNLTATAKRFNVSVNYISDILQEFGVRTKIKRKQKPTGNASNVN